MKTKWLQGNIWKKNFIFKDSLKNKTCRNSHELFWLRFLSHNSKILLQLLRERICKIRIYIYIFRKTDRHEGRQISKVTADIYVRPMVIRTIVCVKDHLMFFLIVYICIFECPTGLSTRTSVNFNLWPIRIYH